MCVSNKFPGDTDVPGGEGNTLRKVTVTGLLINPTTWASPGNFDAAK